MDIIQMNFFRQLHEFGWYSLTLIQIAEDTHKVINKYST